MSKSKAQFFALVAATLILLGATDQAAAGPPLDGWLKQFTVIDKPSPAPDTAFLDGSGDKVTLVRFRGKVVLVNFWATWCAPCIREMPDLDRLQAKMGGDDFTIVTVNEDRGGVETAKKFLAKLGIENLQVYADDRMALMRALDVRGLPTSFLVGRDGRIAGRYEGLAKWDSPEFEKLVRYYME